MMNAVTLAQAAEARARKNKDVSGMLQASSQWLVIYQVNNEAQAMAQEQQKRQIGFTGGNNG